ncbi:MAG TPA: hypothetical protein DEP64_07005 [Ruminococcaceae bacterium]|nr:hypothetical protein [Oscillospiraceae bacterium]
MQNRPRRKADSLNKFSTFPTKFSTGGGRSRNADFSHRIFHSENSGPHARKNRAGPGSRNSQLFPAPYSCY